MEAAVMEPVITDAPETCIDLVEAMDNLKKKKIRKYRPRGNSASQIGHECMRYKVWRRTKWEESELYDVGLQYVFDEGNLQENAIIEELTDAGIEITLQQEKFVLSDLELTCLIDGMIKHQGEEVPLEIKSMSPVIWQTVSTLSDMKNSKYSWVRHYLIQFNLYLYACEKDIGIFYLKNKVSGKGKQIVMPFDEELFLETKENIEKVNEYVKSKEDPPAIDHDESLCGKCSFVMSCLPDRKPSELEIVTDEELALVLDSRNLLLEAHKQYEKIERYLKKKLPKKKVVVGDYLIDGKFIKRKAYAVEAGEYWKRSIQKIA